MTFCTRGSLCRVDMNGVRLCDLAICLTICNVHMCVRMGKSKSVANWTCTIYIYYALSCRRQPDAHWETGSNKVDTREEWGVIEGLKTEHDKVPKCKVHMLTYIAVYHYFCKHAQNAFTDLRNLMSTRSLSLSLEHPLTINAGFVCHGGQSSTWRLFQKKPGKVSSCEPWLDSW